MINNIETKNNLFEKLKRKKTIIKKQPAHTSIFFQLNFDEKGAYIKVVDKAKKDIEADYEYYNGYTRYVLKSIKNIKDKKSFHIDWAVFSDRIYLSENEHLIEQLKLCDNFVNDKFKRISFKEDLVRVLLTIEEKNSSLMVKIIYVYNEKELSKVLFLNENHIYCQGKIFQVLPIGENYSDIQLFETRLMPSDLEKYLSLFFSGLKNISVSYKDCKCVKGTDKKTRPALVFEKIDVDNSLYLRVARSLPGFDVHFFDTYDVTKIVTLNDFEKKIVISDLFHEEIYSCFDEINRLLKKYKRQLKNSFSYYIEDNLFIIDEVLAKEFIHNELTHLITKFSIYGAENLKSYKVTADIPKLNLSLSHGIDFLEGDASLEIEGQKISLFDAIDQYKKNSYILLNDGTHAVVNKNYFNKLKRIFKKQKDKVKISFFDLPIIEELIDEKIAMESFRHSREIFSGFNKLKKSRTNFPKLNAKLRSYQKEGFKWIKYLHKHALGGCLADDMGLGKTLQAIALLADIYPKEKKSSLIIMPKSLLFNWENEIKKFKRELTYYTYHANNRNLEEAKKKQLVLTTYSMVRIDIDKFKDTEFYYIILDESQNVKNINSQISKSVMLLKSDYRLALSGTPIENNLGELYSLFRFLNPAMFRSINDFNKNYVIPIQKEDDKDALHELKKKIYPFILRRLKQDVLKDLPDKIEQTLFIDMSDDQKTFYEQRRLFYYHNIKDQIKQSGIKKTHFFILQALGELRQIASIPESKSENQIISPKRQILVGNILDVAANNHKVLVFANFLNALDCIAEDLNKAGVDYLLMTGATRDRKELVEKFQNDESYKVFLMTLKTGGTGLNLTAADYIFIFDPWWNRSVENQAIDRTHRIGQDKTVFSYKLITRGTIEEKILQLQEMKKELFESLISSDGASMKSLDEKDIDFILGG